MFNSHSQSQLPFPGTQPDAKNGPFPFQSSIRHFAFRISHYYAFRISHFAFLHSTIFIPVVISVHSLRWRHLPHPLSLLSHRALFFGLILNEDLLATVSEAVRLRRFSTSTPLHLQYRSAKLLDNPWSMILLHQEQVELSWTRWRRCSRNHDPTIVLLLIGCFEMINPAFHPFITSTLPVNESVGLSAPLRKQSYWDALDLEQRPDNSLEEVQGRSKVDDRREIALTSTLSSFPSMQDRRYFHHTCDHEAWAYHSESHRTGLNVEMGFVSIFHDSVLYPTIQLVSDWGEQIRWPNLSIITAVTICLCCKSAAKVSLWVQAWISDRSWACASDPWMNPQDVFTMPLDWQIHLTRIVLYKSISTSNATS